MHRKGWWRRYNYDEDLPRETILHTYGHAVSHRANCVAISRQNYIADLIPDRQPIHCKITIEDVAV